MSQIFESSVFFGVFISLSSYIFGIWLKKKTGWALANPLLVSIILVIATLSMLGVSYESYARGAEIISYLLTPATICLAVPLYQQVELLRKNWKAVVAGISAGVLSSLVCILLLARPAVSF